MKRRKDVYMQTFNIAATYVGTIVGAGFASGQEILVFFTKYGISSYIAIIVASFIFMYIGSKLLLLGKRIRANSYGDIIADVFGRLSPLVNIYLFIAYIIISIAMFAGAGALFGNWNVLGVVITAVLAALTIIKGIDGLVHVNAIIIPLLLVFNIIMFLYHLDSPVSAAVSIDISITQLIDTIKSSFMYTAYNIILCIGVLVPLGRSIDKITTARWGGYIGGALISVMLIMSNYCLSLYIQKLHTAEMPLLYIAKAVSPIFGKLYTFILWGAVFTTLIANLFSVVSIIENRLPAHLHNISILVTVLSFALLSRFGFSNIVSILYPILGIIGCIFLVWIAIYRF